MCERPIGYLFDLSKTKRGTYSATLVPGDYVIDVSAPGFMDLSEYFSAVKGDCPGRFKIPKKAPAKLVVTTVDLTTGLPVQGVLSKLSTSTGSMNVEALTTPEGQCEYTTDGCGNYMLNVSREDYVSYSKEVCVSRTSLDKIVVPLIPVVKEAEGDHTTIQICLSGDSACKGMSLVLICPIGTVNAIFQPRRVDNEKLDERRPQSDKNHARLVVTNAGKVGTLATVTSGVNSWYRVGVAVRDPKLTTITKEQLDRHLQNPMQALNILVQIIVNNEVRYTVYPPSYSEGAEGEFWDIGFVNAYNGELMAINALCEETTVSRLDLCSEYFAFYGYVSQKTNYRSAFGTYRI